MKKLRITLLGVLYGMIMFSTASATGSLISWVILFHNNNEYWRYARNAMVISFILVAVFLILFRLLSKSFHKK